MKCQIAYYDMFGNINVSKEVYVANGLTKQEIKKWYEKHVDFCKEVINIMFDK